MLIVQSQIIRQSILHRRRLGFPGMALLCGRACVSPAPFLSVLARQPQDFADGFVIGTRAGEIIEGSFRGFDDVPLDERRAFSRSLFAALDAALPFKNGPAREIVLGKLGKYGGKVDLAVACGAKTAGALDPRLVSTIDALLAGGNELRIFYVKHLD